MTLALFLGVVLVAFLSEAMVGFGSTVIAVTLGAHLYPLDVLLPAFVPVNLALSVYLVLRHRTDIDARVLTREILPFMGLGLPIGLYVFALRDQALLMVLFAAFVVVLAALELRRVARAGAQVHARPLPLAAAGGLLVVGGFIHGVYGSGGPMVVYVASRAIHDKGRFRATLSALWLVLNSVLVTSYAATGRLTAETGTVSAAMVPALLAGGWLGERLHGQVRERTFRVAVFALLLLAGAVLLARGLSNG